jgi:subtilase family serine protease
MSKRRESRCLFPVLLLSLLCSAVPEAMASARQMITKAIDPTNRIELVGNTRSEANAANDVGRVEDSMVMEHMQLLLKRPAELETQLTQFVDSLHDKNSSNYHQWLTAQQFGDTYGVASNDVELVKSWLRSAGFTVNGVHTSKMGIDFSGTAGQVRAAFKTEIHRYNVKGMSHIANASNPSVPEALAEVVHGVVSLHDFRPHTNYKAKSPDYTYTSGTQTLQAVVPGDLWKIYNLTPLFSAGITGAGQTIAIIEDTNVYSTADWTTFRTTFGLNAYSTTATLTQVHPTGGSTCKNPGVVAGDESEAELDVEWASAGAPAANIELASCANTSTTFGGLIALENLVNSSTPPTIVSMSYGECEAENGATANAAFNTTYKQAVAEGTSIYVSAGDEGAASCDADLAKSTHGIGVSGFASTVYNVAVGGTDFGDTSAGTISTYWNTTNTATYESAKSYIPEIPWNDSCASSLLATFNGYSATYGTSGFCNSKTGEADYLTTGSGSGGPSGCATGSASKSGVVGGTCKGYAKPSWQSLVGNPADGVRDMPDVSLFAANGVWGHYYVYCDSDTGDQGAACTGAPSGWSGAGGTSFAAPIWAGFQALVNQHTGAKQGNPNPTFYALAKTEYGTSGSATCNSANGNTAGSSCIFYDVTQGDMDVNCTGTNNCYRPSGTNGVLSTSNSSYSKAYGTNTGWDYATGIGTVNVYNLVMGW